MFERPAWRRLSPFCYALALLCFVSGLYSPTVLAATNSSLEYKSSSVVEVGNSSSDSARQNVIAVDSAGNTIIGGSITGTAQLGGQALNTANMSGYVAKYNPAGHMLWYRAIYTDNSDNGQSTVVYMAVDSNDNIIVSGSFMNTVTFDGQGGQRTVTTVNGPNVYNSNQFISKYSADGTYQWTTVGDVATNSLTPRALTLDSSNNIYVGGTFSGTVRFSTNGGTPARTASGNFSGYYAKYDSNGVYLSDRTYLAVPATAVPQNGQYSSVVTSILVDHQDRLIVGAYATGAEIATAGQPNFNTVTNVRSSAYVMRYKADGSFEWNSKLAPLSSQSTVSVSRLAVDSHDNIFVGGRFRGTVAYPTATGTAQLQANSDPQAVASAFIISLASGGTARWAAAPYNNLVGGNSYSTVGSLVVDAADNLYSVGDFGGSTTFDGQGGNDTYNISNDMVAAYTTKYGNDGTYIWTDHQIRPGDSQYDYAGMNGATLDKRNGILHILGEFSNKVALNGTNQAYTYTNSQYDPNIGILKQFLVSYYLTAQPVSITASPKNVAVSSTVTNASQVNRASSGVIHNDNSMYDDEAPQNISMVTTANDDKAAKGVAPGQVAATATDNQMVKPLWWLIAAGALGIIGVSIIRRIQSKNT